MHMEWEKILIIAGSGSGKTNSLFNLISHLLDIDKNYLYAKDLYEGKYRFLIKNVKILEQSILMMQKFLLSIQTIWIIKPLKIVIQIKSLKY